MKIHIGCGAVYLRGWVNADVPTPHTFLAKDRPDLVQSYITDESNYYGRHQDKTIDTLRNGPLQQEYVCDTYLNEIGGFPIPWDDPVDEVLMRHSFEHFSIREARRVLRYYWLSLCNGGILRIDVPDHEETIKKLLATHDPFYIRHLLGPRHDDEYGFHMMSYTREKLIKLVTEHAAPVVTYEYLGEEPNIHIYPSFCLRFRKVHPNATDLYTRYVLPGLPE